MLKHTREWTLFGLREWRSFAARSFRSLNLVQVDAPEFEVAGR